MKKSLRKNALVGDNVEVGVYPLKRPLSIAQELELDLVEFPKASPRYARFSNIKILIWTKKRESTKI